MPGDPWTPGQPTEMYHGSPHKLDQLEPRGHYLDDAPVVFGSPNRGMAISHLARWTDDDFDQGTVNGGPLTMREKYPGAFEKVYGGKRGFIYQLDPKPFKYTPSLMREERVSHESPSILNMEEIPDALQALRDSGVVMEKAAATAVVIKGNPKYIQGNPRADKFYSSLAKHLEQRGYSEVILDPGKPYTSPPKADLWVGHSRGADRLRFAPAGTKTIDLGPLEHPKSVARYKETQRVAKEKGVPYDQLPLHDRAPIPEHYVVTQDMLRAFDSVRKHPTTKEDRVKLSMNNPFENISNSLPSQKEISRKAKKVQKATTKNIEQAKQNIAAKFPKLGAQIKLDPLRNAARRALPRLGEAGVGAALGGAAGYGTGTAFDEVDRPTATMVGALLGAAAGPQIGDKYRYNGLRGAGIDAYEGVVDYAKGNRSLARDAGEDLLDEHSMAGDAWHSVFRDNKKTLDALSEKDAPPIIREWPGMFGSGRAKLEQGMAERGRQWADASQQNYFDRAFDAKLR